RIRLEAGAWRSTVRGQPAPAGGRPGDLSEQLPPGDGRQTGGTPDPWLRQRRLSDKHLAAESEVPARASDRDRGGLHRPRAWPAVSRLRQPRHSRPAWRAPAEEL